MPLRPLALPDSLISGPFTTRELLAAGAPAQRVRSPDLRRVAHGIHRPRSASGSTGDATAAERGWLPEEVRAYQRMVPHAVVSHTTAARLHGLPLPAWAADERDVHLTFTAGAGRTRRRGLVAHQAGIPALDVALVAGVRVTTPPRTLWDLCSLHPRLSVEDLVVVADAVMAPGWDDEHGFLPGEHSAAALREALGRRGRFRGVRAAREVAERMREDVASPMETRTRLGLVDQGLPEPEVQVRLWGEDGAKGPVVDLAFPQWRVVVQYEGARHRTREQQECDVRRDRWCADHGWTVIKVVAADVHAGLGPVAARILRLAQR